MAKIIKGSEFENEVIKSDIPVLVDFFATWCAPCKLIAPMLDELSSKMEDKAKVLKVDVDDAEAADIVMKFGIRSVPTMIFFKNGEAADIVVGGTPQEILAQKLTALI